MAVSLLLHIALACALTLWLPRRAPTPPEPEQSVEMLFQPVAESTTELPPTPPVAAALTPPEPPLPQPVEAAPTPPEPPPPQPVKTASPPPLIPPPPPAEEAPVPAPAPEPAPTVVEAPKPPPKPTSPPARPRQRPVARAQAAPSTAPASPPAAPPPAPAEAPPAPISAAWRQELSAWLAAHKSYPDAARRRGEEGSVALHFTVERSGRVTEVSVMRGSGSSILDAAAEAMLRNAMLPAFPAAMTQERISVTVQIHFALAN